LGQIVNTSEDKEVHFKYIEAATKTRNFKEVNLFLKKIQKLKRNN